MFFAKEAFKKLPGGDLYLAGLTADSPLILDRDLLGATLQNALQHEARVHGAIFSPVGFGKVMKQLAAGKIKIMFFAAAWNLCHQIPLGAQIFFPSLSVVKVTDHLMIGPGYHTEDFTLAGNPIRHLMKAKPPSASFPPDFGLAKYCDLNCMQYMIEHGAIGRSGEVDPQNTSIRRVIEPLGAKIGHASDSAIFKITSVPESMLSTWKPEISIRDFVGLGGERGQSTFVTTWASRDSRFQLVSTYTKVTSTFLGDPIVKASISTTGNFDECLLGSVLSATLEAGEKTVRQLKWGIADVASQSSHAFADASDRQGRILPPDDGIERTNPKPEWILSEFFGGPSLETHVNVLQEPQVLAAFRRHSVTERRIGEKTSQPAQINLQEVRGLNYSVNPRPRPLLNPFDRNPGLCDI